MKGCNDVVSSRPNFPNPMKYLALFSKWVEACGIENLENLQHSAIWGAKKVCFPFSPMAKEIFEIHI